MVGLRSHAAWSAAILAGVIALSGCTVGGGGSASPTSTGMALPTPPSASQPPRAAEIQNLDAQGYFALTQEERLAYVDYRLTANAENHAVSAKDKDRPVWTPVTLDMPGQQILDNFNYLSDEAGFSVLVSADGPKYLWVDEAVKLQSGAYWDSPGPADMSNLFLRDVDFIVGLEGEGAYLSEQKWTLITDGAPTQGADQGRVPVTYRDLVFSDETGAVATGRFNYLPFTTLDGQAKAAWLLDTIQNGR